MVKMSELDVKFNGRELNQKLVNEYYGLTFGFAEYSKHRNLPDIDTRYQLPPNFNIFPLGIVHGSKSPQDVPLYTRKFLGSEIEYMKNVAFDRDKEIMHVTVGNSIIAAHKLLQLPGPYKINVATLFRAHIDQRDQSISDYRFMRSFIFPTVSFDEKDPSARLVFKASWHLLMTPHYGATEKRYDCTIAIERGFENFPMGGV